MSVYPFLNKGPRNYTLWAKSGPTNLFCKDHKLRKIFKVFKCWKRNQKKTIFDTMSYEIQISLFINFYWNVATLICLQHCCYFCTTVAELSGCNSDCVAGGAWGVCCCALYGRSLPTFSLNPFVMWEQIGVIRAYLSCICFLFSLLLRISFEFSETYSNLSALYIPRAFSNLNVTD